MKKLLIIGTVWPEPTSTAAGKRMLQLISIFKKLDYESPESDQFEKEFEKMVILSHKSGRNFFISNDYSRFTAQ